MPKPAIVLGIHCASAAKNVAMCAARSTDDGLELIATCRGRDDKMAQEIISYIDRDEPTLIALDTPLGWPLDLTSVLSSHQAGLPLRLKPGSLFYRECDRMLKRQFDINCKPVGADRTALTSYAALTFLDHIGYHHGMRIPMAWDQFLQFPVQAIEVSGPATLATLDLPASKLSSKGTEGADARNAVLKGLESEMDFGEQRQSLLDCQYQLTAAINALSAHYFIREKLIQPQDIHSARKEGWIWVKEPEKDDSEPEEPASESGE